MKLFCTGDLHIGRRSTSLSESLLEHSCASAWLRAVDLAITEKADLVLLSGDVIDGDNQYFEAAGPLLKGIQKLTEHDIHLCAVAGNHDFSALPQFLKRQSGECIHLLGEGGQWEDVVIERNGEKLRIFGWSFQHGTHDQNPISDLQVDRSEIPAIGLLHCDIDSSDTKYVPVPLRDLKNQSEICFWLTGHIHAPALYDGGGTPVLNPGSLQAMDPGETGDHGPWIVDINGGIVSETRHLKTSTVKYCKFDIDVTGWECVEIKSGISDEIYNRVDAEKEDSGAKIISARVTLCGQTNAHDEIKKIKTNLPGTVVSGAYIDKLDIATTPIKDLQTLVQGKGPLAITARMLVSIENETFAQDYPELLEDVVDKMTQTYGTRAYSLIRKEKTEYDAEDIEPDQAMAISVIKAQCLQLLNNLMEADSKNETFV